MQGERQEEQAHHDPQLWHRASHHYFRQPEEGNFIVFRCLYLIFRIEFWNFMKGGRSYYFNLFF